MQDDSPHHPGTAPNVSVIVTAGSGDSSPVRSVDSLARQTISGGEVEILFVDDGSDRHDDARQRLADTDHAARVLRPSRPGSAGALHNAGLDAATGEYVLFADAECALLPDALDRAYRYASAHRSDVLALSGASTSNPWQALASATAENVPNALHERGIARLQPSFAPKLYRRQFLIDHDIRCPEDHLATWRDIVLAVLAYRNASVVSVLADRPAYRWYGGDPAPDGAGAWDRIDELVAFLVTALDGPDHEDARLELLAEHLCVRALDRLSGPPPQDERRRRTDQERARTLVRRYGTRDVLEMLPRRQRIQAELLLGSGLELGGLARRVDLGMVAGATGRSARWDGGLLRLALECTWQPQSPGARPLQFVGDRLRWVVADEIADVVPERLFDVTEDADELTVRLCLRGRHDRDAWEIPVTLDDPGFQEGQDGGVRLVARGEATIDPAGMAGAAAIGDDVWDVRVRTGWLGFQHEAMLRYEGGTLPAVVGGRAIVAYRSTKGMLAIDTAGRERTLVVDARPRTGAPSPVDALSIPLDNLTVVGDSEFDAGALLAIPEAAAPDAGAAVSTEPTEQELENHRRTGALRLSVKPLADGPQLQGSVVLGPGRYRMYARRGDRWRRTACAFLVGSDGTLTVE